MAYKVGSSHAGHGGAGNWADPGAVGSGYREADLARTINSKVVKALKCNDATDNKGRNVNENLYNIVQKVNASPGGIQLSHHFNSANERATGVEVFYGAPSERALAAQISKAIANALGLPDRGAKDGSWLYVASNTNPDKKMLLIEWAFISNPNDMIAIMKNMDKAINALLGCLGYNGNVSGGSGSTPAPAPSKPAQAPSGGKWQLVPEKGIFTPNTKVAVKPEPTVASKELAVYDAGQDIIYDYYVVNDGYTWVSYIGGSGNRRYAACRETGKAAWGSFR